MERDKSGWGRGEPLPAGWCWTECPQCLVREAVARGRLSTVGRAAVKRDGTGFTLALPWSWGQPFPVPPLFCLARWGSMAGREFIFFCFSRQGCAELLHSIPGGGDDSDVITHQGGKAHA